MEGRIVINIRDMKGLYVCCPKIVGTLNFYLFLIECFAHSIGSIGKKK